MRAHNIGSDNRGRRIRQRTLALCLVLVTSAVVAAPELEEIVVRAEASVAAMQGKTGSVTTVDADAVSLTRASHVHEIMVRVPGMWVSRGSGQEHLTAIRSGVLTGAGACGAFLYLENGVPIRPPGFCNVNNLFELNTEQAVAIEAVRGPASALFGGNALYGAVNTVTSTSAEGWRGSIEAGPYRYLQARVTGGGAAWRLDGLSTSSSGFRDDTGYGQQKVYAGARGALGGWDVVTTITATLLNQETGGFVRGFEAYDSDLRRTNPNPEAYRDAWSARATSVWRRELTSSTTLTATPYLRRSSMVFLQHFLPGQPLEENGQDSAGAQVRLGSASGGWRWTAGAVLDVFHARLSERQDDPTRGSPFLVATRPPGTHYDFRVRGLTLATFYDAGIDLSTDVELVASARLERNGYAYENRHLDGNTRDDGSTCAFGGCLYTRPADRDDAFANAAGRLGLYWSPASHVGFHVVTGRGFRPPQTTELYRLQRGQLVTDLDSETLRSVQAGMRGAGERFHYDVALYAQTTKHLIFRDANGFNVSDGRTESAGIEFAVVWNAGPHTLDLAATYARHRYGFARDVGGERIAHGNAMDTAPRWLGSARWRFENGRGVSEFEVIHLGPYFANASNTARYDGHRLLNWRGAWDATPRVRLFARLANVLDVAYADRADFAFGSYRYFPGMPRQVYVGVEVKLFE